MEKKPENGPTCDQIIESLPDPFVVIDKQYRIRAANSRYARQFGYETGEVIGRHCYEISHRSECPCSQHGEHCPLEHVFGVGEATQVIHVHYDQNGAEERVRISATPLRDADGRIEFMGESMTTIQRPDVPTLLIGRSPQMLHVISLLQRVAGTRTTVLLLGESGVGKECVAQYLHQYSKRWDRPFVVVDCGVLGEQLIESELFGYEKGAFTGADRRKQGLIEAADGGTLFIDEIGELPTELQTKLLRVLESGTIRRIGETEYRQVDVRIVAATNKDLRTLSQQGRFREDLYYRLSAFPVTIPPLRERKGDIAALTEHFLGMLENGEQHLPLAPDVLEALLDHDYPGNIRELRNVIERALILAAGDALTPDHIVIDREEDRAPSESPRRSVPPVGDKALLRRRARRPSTETLLEALSQADGNRREAARILGVSERSLYRYLKEISLPTA